MSTTSYNVEIHGNDTDGWGASIPDLHVYAGGTTRDEALREVASAAQWHVDGLVEDGLPVPASSCETVSAAVPVRV